jgi:hypothetical protein
LYLLGQAAEFLEVGEEDLDLGAFLRERRATLGDHGSDYENVNGCGAKVDILRQMAVTWRRDNGQE